MKIQIHEKLVISALQDYKMGTKQEQKIPLRKINMV